MSLVRKWQCYLSLFFCCISISLLGSEQGLLQAQDVNKIMKQIFDQHVDKKSITDVILKNSFKVYIDQFDPYRVYLLESEVRPFLRMGNAELAKILQQYQKSEFSEYNALNEVIQKAIIRQRNIRKTFESNDGKQLLEDSRHYSASQYAAWEDPDLNKKFPANDTELKNRVRTEIIHFLAGERKRFGDAYVQTHLQQIFNVFEQEAQDIESQYLFVKDDGQPMGEKEKQNAFFLHVLKALANSLDAHTKVLSEREAYDMKVRLEKEIQGIGIEIQETDIGSFIVSKVLEGSPAANSKNIKTSDRLLEIDHTSLQGKSFDEVMELLGGKTGTPITLLMQHIDPQTKAPVATYSITLKRQEITLNDDRAQSSYLPFDHGVIGEITLDAFYQSPNGITSEHDVANAIKKLDEKGNLRGLILDLRENSGGFLSQAVKVAGLFITNGVIVVSRYFNGEEHFYRDMDSSVAYNGPLVILTSKATASAAEIVAQALQDYGVAIIVGDEHTYGKGTIQSQTVTDNQGSAYFKVTVGTYYTVSGKTPQIQGVKADVVVPSQFVHENMGEEYLDYPLQQKEIPPSFDDHLDDVAANLKPWYMHYYMPTMQHRLAMWRTMVPELQKRSAKRIANNREYQAFLRGSQGAAEGQDFQMQEAINIIKDMIELQMKMRGTEQNKKAEATK